MTDKIFFNDTVIVTAKEAPQVRKFTPKSGSNAGKEQQVLSFRAYHPNFRRTTDGKFEKTSVDFYELQCFDAAAAHLQKFICDGLKLVVLGIVQEKTYKNKEGKEVVEKVVTIRNVGADLLQRGLSDVSFTKPVTETK